MTYNQSYFVCRTAVNRSDRLAQPRVSVFSSPVIQRIIEQEFGVLYSISAVNYLLHRLGYSYLCPRPKHEKSDPAAQEAFKKSFRKRWLKSPSIIPANE